LTKMYWYITSSSLHTLEQKIFGWRCTYTGHWCWRTWLWTVKGSYIGRFQKHWCHWHGHCWCVQSESTISFQVHWFC
jgi:hypothetical protein